MSIDTAPHGAELLDTRPGEPRYTKFRLLSLGCGPGSTSLSVTLTLSIKNVCPAVLASAIQGLYRLALHAPQNQSQPNRPVLFVTR